MRQADLSTLLAAGARALTVGDLAAARAAYRDAIVIAPGSAEIWFNLAWVERADRQFAAALHGYGEAIRHGVDRPEEAHLNRAAILAEHLFRSEDAAEELAIALAINPRFVPAWLNLGLIHEDLGEADSASDAYRRVVEVEPFNGRAHARLAALALVDGQADAAAGRLARVIDRAPTLGDRAEILFALGDTLDRLGRYDEAFGTYRAANDTARSIARVAYDPAAHSRLADRLIATFPSPVVSRDALPQPHPEPVFICGMFRSGSTLAERVLGRHSAVTAAGELEFIPGLVRSLNPYPEVVPALDERQITDLRRAYLSALPVGGIVTDKRCDNFLHIGLIKSLFPRAQIIHTVREPLDNLLSVYFLNFGEAVTYGHDLDQIAHYYVQYRRLMTHWSRVFPGDIITLSYDELVTRPRDAVAGLLDGLGLPFEEACLTPERGDAAVRTASAWQVRQPVHARSSGRWRHYERHLGAVRSLLGAAGY